MGPYDYAKGGMIGVLIGIILGLSIGYMINNHIDHVPPQIDKEAIYEKIIEMDAHDVVEHYLPGITDEIIRSSSEQAERVSLRLWAEFEEVMADYFRRRIDTR